MIKISAVIITLNEEKVIEQTLLALRWCDEVVVVDSGSTDQTLAICARYNCKVVHRKFDGYGAQKQFAVAMASNDWVLSIDADEVLTPELQEEIQLLREKQNLTIKGFFIPRTLIFMGKQIRFGGQYRKSVLRLFDRKYGHVSNDIVHEQIRVEGETATLKNHMLHYSYQNTDDYLKRFNSYTTAAAISLHKRGKKPSMLMLVLRQPLTFLQIYVLKGCFLDGFPGFAWAFLSSFYPVVKYIKLEEMATRNR